MLSRLVPIFVRLAEGEYDIFELVHYVARGVIHKLQGALIIRLLEMMLFRETECCEISD